MLGVSIDASKFSLPTKGADITSATYISETATGNTNSNYCLVLGSIHPVDKTAPDIKFQLNIPNNWNEKVLQSGGGGYNGNIPKTTGYTTLGLTNIPTPLASGYMTLADDSGHQAADSNDASFAMNDEALVNFGYMHIKKAPYAAHVLVVELFFQIALGANLISADHKNIGFDLTLVK